MFEELFEELKEARQEVSKLLRDGDNCTYEQKQAIENGNVEVLKDIAFEANYITENRDFLIALNDLEVTPSVKKLNDIVKNHIIVGGPGQLNIDSNLRLKIEAAAKDPKKIAEISKIELASSKYEYHASLEVMQGNLQELSTAVEAIPEKLKGSTTLKSLKAQLQTITSCQLPEATVERINLQDDKYSEFENGFNAVKESLENANNAKLFVITDKYADAKKAFSKLEEVYSEFKKAKADLVEKTAQHDLVASDLKPALAASDPEPALAASEPEPAPVPSDPEPAPVPQDVKRALQNKEVQQVVDQLSQELENQPETTEKNTSHAAALEDRNSGPEQGGGRGR